MKTLHLIQGTPEWFAHRAACFNASDAPAMLGISPYKTRAQLLQERATGVTPEIDAATQKRFDDGHRYEALARPLAEGIIGDELYPCVGTDDEGRYSASFDGLTLLEDTAFEHKSLNDDLRAIAVGNAIDMAMLPEHYCAQMEQQCMVSGAKRVLFMASKWNGDELVAEAHGWYAPNSDLRARIVAGWEQFARDVAAYQPEPTAAPTVVGRAPETLPALRVEAQGMVTFSNLAEFRENAMTVLGAINRDLQTDEDFADAEQTVKWCKGVEDRLDAAKANVLAQMQSVDEVCRTIDSVSAETRKVRLELDRLVKAEKEHRRAEIVAEGVAAVRAHYDAINATLGAHALAMAQSTGLTIGNAIKGRKTLTSIRDAVDTAVAAAKIEASQQAERVRQNIAVLDAFKEHAHLFADRVALCGSKTPEDLRNLCAARVAEHQQREAERLEAERARIRAEEQAKAERARQEEAARIEREQQAQPMPEVATPAAVATAHSEQAPTAAVRSGAKIKLGDINARIAPLSISADGLAQLGFEPVEHQRSAKLYAAADLPAILQAMVDVLQGRLPLRKTA